MIVREVLRTLIAFDTVSDRSNLALIDWVSNYVDGHGARVRLTRDETGQKANLLASFGPEKAGGIVLSAHTDVVPVEGQDWSSDPFTLTERNDRLYGRGTADMKSFAACCLAAVPEWSKGTPLARPIHIALSYDGEVGCLGVPHLIADMTANLPRPAVAVIGEPTSMAIGDGHRGFYGFLTMFHGHAAHSSDPSAGVSAVGAAAEFIRYLEALDAESRERATGTTFNVGRITGGSAINIVPSRCDVVWEFRPAAAANVIEIRRRIEDFLEHGLSRAVTATTELLVVVPPLAPDAEETAIRMARDLGAEDTRVTLPFGTEAGHFQAAGIPSVVCGPGSISQAHQADEWIALFEIAKGERFIAEVGRWART